MNIGLAVGGGEGSTLDEMTDRIVEAENDGFASVWMANVFNLDALTALAFAGKNTRRIELGTAVIPTYPRHPHALAQQALTAEQATGGRLVLGIGRSHKLVIETMFGIPYDKPIAHMREYVTVLKELMEKGAAGVSGEAYQVNAPLKIKNSKPVPVMIGALRPKMLEVCGTLCDGTLTWMAGPKYIENEIEPRLRRAAKAAGRDKPRIVASLPVCVTDDPDGAREVIGKALQIYGQLPVYRACLDAEGAAGPADIALVGDEKTVEEGLRRVAACGASDFYAAAVAVGADRGVSLARTNDLLKGLAGKL